MILKSSKNLLSLLILLLCSPLKGEDKIDIWSNKKEDLSEQQIIRPAQEKKNNINQVINPKNNKIIKIENSLINTSQERKIYGVYDPAEYNFNLNMWSNTKADDVRSSIKRLKKIKLSKTSAEIFENILLSFSYPPDGMSEKEFTKLKVDWLIENNRSELIENFLKQNNEFDGKSRLVQYLVDENISQANIKRGCEKIKFIDGSIKDSYLEKFRILNTLQTIKQSKRFGNI